MLVQFYLMRIQICQQALQYNTQYLLLIIPSSQTISRSIRNLTVRTILNPFQLQHVRYEEYLPCWSLVSKQTSNVTKLSYLIILLTCADSFLANLAILIHSLRFILSGLLYIPSAIRRAISLPPSLVIGFQTSLQIQQSIVATTIIVNYQNVTVCLILQSMALHLVV